MRNPDSAFRPRVLANAAFVMVAAGMAASCSNASRFGEPFFTGSTQNQREIIGQADSQPMPAAIPAGTAAVTSADLPPPAATAYAPSNYDAGNSYANTADDSNYGWSAVGGQVTTVGRSETLDVLASKYGVPQEQILAANQMRSAADIRPGKVVVIPHRVAITREAAAKPIPARYTPPSETVAPATAAAPAMPHASAGTHTVAAGETLYSISRRYGTTVPTLASLNGLDNAAAIRSGQVLRLPGAGNSSTTIAAATPSAPKPAETKPVRVASIDPKVEIPAKTTASEPPMANTANAPTVPAVPSVPVNKGPGASDTAAASAAIDKAADAGSASGTEFRWPVRGRIIAGFGAKPNGEKNDGINLAVPEGTAVKAAEAGTVIYAGNELEGYGNLILVRHADGWVSAYANNRDIAVKRGDKVRRGETIAHAGMTGSVSSPQVHFELRKGAKPVNPLDYLAT
jgi:murein DD-endopeptidase MepM/ murein hydrolase activator NlpD